MILQEVEFSTTIAIAWGLRVFNGIVKVVPMEYLLKTNSCIYIDHLIQGNCVVMGIDVSILSTFWNVTKT